MPEFQPSVRADGTLVIHPSDSRNNEFIFEDTIKAEHTISAVVSVDVSPSGELDYTGEAANTEIFNDQPNGKGEDVPVGKAVVAAPSGGVAGKNYDVTIVVTLQDADSNPAGNCTGVWLVKVRDGTEIDQ